MMKKHSGFKAVQASIAKQVKAKPVKKGKRK